MRFKLNLLTVCVLMAGAVFAQEDFESVEDIMNELMNYEEEKPSDAETTAPASPQKDPDGIRQPDETPSAEETDVGTAEPDMPVEREGPVQPGSVSAPAAAGTDEPVQTEPVQRNSEDASVAAEADVPVQEEGVLPLSDAEILALARALNMEMEEVIQLIDNARDQEKETIRALQELADIIKTDPDRQAGGTRLPHDHGTAEIKGMQAVDAAWSTELVLRSFDLVAGSGKRMKLGDTTRAVNVETLFSVVDFPEGSSAIYQPKTETLYVNNTPENLQVLETMLSTMGVLKEFGQAYQIEIESKFVEVSEGTLEELGFQWNFEDPTSIGNDYEMNDGPGGLFSEALRGSPNNSEGGRLPFERKIDLGDGTVSASGDWSTFRFVDTFDTEPASMNVQNQGGNAFDVVISALDQSTGADVLSAPRILTRNGEKASIRVGEIHYFPEVYEGDSAQATIPNITYEDFKERLLGVELTVTPKVTGDRDIMLALNPRISELVGYQTYQLAPENSIYNHRQLETTRRRDHPPLVASLPIIKKREISTQVTMADGSTIGMGGLINESVEQFDDRVPFMGSIPMIGRLFRNEGERVVKRNLLMFVTAKVVDPNGRIDSSRSFE